jgi:hypothetical protein
MLVDATGRAAFDSEDPSENLLVGVNEQKIEKQKDKEQQ